MTHAPARTVTRRVLLALLGGERLTRSDIVEHLDRADGEIMEIDTIYRVLYLLRDRGAVQTAGFEHRGGKGSRRTRWEITDTGRAMAAQEGLRMVPEGDANAGRLRMLLREQGGAETTEIMAALGVTQRQAHALAGHLKRRGEVITQPSRLTGRKRYVLALSPPP